LTGKWDWKKNRERQSVLRNSYIFIGSGLGLNFVGVNPIQALIYTAILYGLTAPVMIVMVMHIGNNKVVMGKFTNSRWSNILGGLTLFLMTISAFALLYFQFKLEKQDWLCAMSCSIH
jgi:Mn2+/Fe2+ NRAMP family transporter